MRVRVRVSGQGQRVRLRVRLRLRLTGSGSGHTAILSSLATSFAGGRRLVVHAVLAAIQRGGAWDGVVIVVGARDLVRVGWS